MGRWIGLVVPGLPQLLRGKVPEGVAALFFWVALLALTVTRFDRITASFGGGLEDRVALVTLVVVLGGVGGGL